MNAQEISDRLDELIESDVEEWVDGDLTAKFLEERTRRVTIDWAELYEKDFDLDTVRDVLSRNGFDVFFEPSGPLKKACLTVEVPRRKKDEKTG
tara:strand:+ start:4907 stop:5188 length:282 start_codon:yes stop_codon:yes gene_type:complete